MQDKPSQDKTDDQIAWMQEVIIENTPAWAHFLAIIAQFRGMRWMHSFPLPIVRRFTDLSIKTDTNTVPAGKGFRPGSVFETQHIRIFKRGRMIAERKFTAPRLTNKSPFAKI